MISDVQYNPLVFSVVKILNTQDANGIPNIINIPNEVMSSDCDLLNCYQCCLNIIMSV